MKRHQHRTFYKKMKQLTTGLHLQYEHHLVHVEYITSGELFLSYRDKTPMTTCIQNVQYVDDLTVVAENRKELQLMLDALNRACTRWGMKISVDINTGGDWRATNQGATETEEAPVARTSTEDARPSSATEATATVQTERKEKARRDLLAVGACHQQKPN